MEEDFSDYLIQLKENVFDMIKNLIVEICRQNCLDRKDCDNVKETIKYINSIIRSHPNPIIASICTNNIKEKLIVSAQSYPEYDEDVLLSFCSSFLEQLKKDYIQIVSKYLSSNERRHFFTIIDEDTIFSC